MEYYLKDESGAPILCSCCDKFADRLFEDEPVCRDCFQVLACWRGRETRKLLRQGRFLDALHMAGDDVNRWQDQQGDFHTVAFWQVWE